MAVDLSEVLSDLERGNRRALARLLTWVEDGDPSRLRDIVASIFGRTGRARVIGITGPPGVGKSTLTSGLATSLRGRGRSVAILAIDPSSPFSGGALLGDRIRMQGHHADPDVFIRSMATRGRLGGLSTAAPHAVLVLDAAGFDDIVIETVGVGQSEVEVAATADTTVVALAPGMGDGVQAAKAGILEVADVLVVNKADHGGAGQLEAELRAMLEMDHELRVPAEAMSWWPPILRTVAVRSEGIDDVAGAIEEHGRFLFESGTQVGRGRLRAAHMIREIALLEVRSRMANVRFSDDALLESLAVRVAERDLDPYAAADDLLDAVVRGD